MSVVLPQHEEGENDGDFNTNVDRLSCESHSDDVVTRSQKLLSSRGLPVQLRTQSGTNEDRGRWRGCEGRNGRMCGPRRLQMRVVEARDNCK